MCTTFNTIYIAGPMSGIPEFNFPAFDRAEYWLKKDGWIVFNPAKKESEEIISDEAFEIGDAEMASEDGLDFRENYLWDISKVIESGAIYMLEGWEKSPGARGEHAVAVALQRHYPEYRIIYQ